MNCSTFRRYLNEADTAVALPAQMQEHVLDCHVCQMEWRIQQNFVRALELESELQPSPQFTAALMAKLPALVPAKAQRNYESVLLVALLLAGLLTTWFASEGLRQNFFAIGAEGSWLAAMTQQVLNATVWKWYAALTNILGEQILQQGSQLLLITLVTAAVAKGAVVLDERLRKMLRRL
ncbi:MAG: hypothetical protein AAB354_04200 [candidate division KSB1 bacterium]